LKARREALLTAKSAPVLEEHEDSKKWCDYDLAEESDAKGSSCDQDAIKGFQEAKEEAA
jgi:hypothetical protein